MWEGRRARQSKVMVKNPDLEHIRVHDCMRVGILSCAADAPLGEVAGLMAKHRVHAAAVTQGDTSRPVGIVTDLDVAAAAASGEELEALQVASSEPVAISANETMHHAAQMMVEHGVAHLVVLDTASGYPIGIVSTLDVAAVYAGARSEVDVE
jgi:CBS domain-containing protein